MKLDDGKQIRRNRCMAGAKFRCRVLLAGLCIALLALAATNGRAQNPGTTTAPPAGADANGRATEKDQDRLKKMSLEELMKLDVATVTTASKKAEKATEAPGTVVVIDARDIQMRGYSNLKDVLRDLPGMETTEYFFSEFGTQVPVRGIQIVASRTGAPLRVAKDIRIHRRDGRAAQERLARPHG